ncbi:MAG: hypothetical protein ACRDRT_01665 [Pseudonocardiaceae bacterium]
MLTAEAAHRDSVHAAVSVMAAKLQELVGQRLVAYVTGSRSNKTVARWASGDNTPNPKGLSKLRALYRTVLILETEEPPETIRAWLTSSNPILGDAVPAEVLRTDDPVRVFHAAQAFIEN